ncbi:MAG: hypothetical protein ABJP02_00610 [Parasphingorhabdus sp.]|uniref:hypothetical protein n=1 Tax=Parasphingorhabdus sp. TaxID=2709688 RepID=UPI00329910C0
MSYSGPFVSLSQNFFKDSVRLSPRETILVEHQIQKSVKDFKIAGDLSILASLSATIGFIVFCVGMMYFFTGSNSYDMALKIGCCGLVLAALSTAAASWKTKMATDRIEVIRKLFGP